MNIIEKLGITPGPWIAEHTYISAMVKGKRPNGEVIGSMHPSISGLFSDSQNARNTLCAAASPEMLLWIIGMIEARNKNDMEKGSQLLDLGDELIQKATGKTSEEIKELFNE